MSGEREILKSSSLFEIFSEEVIDRFVREAERRDYPAGNIIFAEMTQGDEIFLIMDGEVAIQIALANEDQQFEIVTLKPGEIMGEVCFIESGLRSATATTVTDTRMLVWKNTAWRHICEEDYEVGYRLVLGIAKILCERLRRMNITVLDSVSWGLE